VKGNGSHGGVLLVAFLDVPWFYKPRNQSTQFSILRPG